MNHVTYGVQNNFLSMYEILIQNEILTVNEYDTVACCSNQLRIIYMLNEDVILSTYIKHLRICVYIEPDMEKPWWYTWNCEQLFNNRVFIYTVWKEMCRYRLASLKHNRRALERLEYCKDFGKFNCALVWFHAFKRTYNDVVRIELGNTLENPNFATTQDDSFRIPKDFNERWKVEVKMPMIIPNQISRKEIGLPNWIATDKPLLWGKSINTW